MFGADRVQRFYFDIVERLKAVSENPQSTHYISSKTGVEVEIDSKQIKRIQEIYDQLSKSMFTLQSTDYQKILNSHLEEYLSEQTETPLTPLLRAVISEMLFLKTNSDFDAIFFRASWLGMHPFAREVDEALLTLGLSPDSITRLANAFWTRAYFIVSNLKKIKD